MRFLVLLLAVFATDVSAATLRGRIVDATGSVLPGVAVEVDGIATLTRPDGTYAIEVGEGRQTVTFRLLEFATVSRTVAAPATLDVTMVLEPRSVRIRFETSF